MKVYVLTIDEVYDYEGFHHAPRVFTDKQKALDALHNTYLNVKREFDDWEEDDYTKGDTCFSMYPEGSWGTSHYDARVDEVEVDE